MSRKKTDKDQSPGKPDRRAPRDAAPTNQGSAGHSGGAGSTGGAAPGEARPFSVVDRRSGVDRRAAQAAASGLERRRGVGRRLSDFTKSAEEGEMTREQFLFVAAIDGYKRTHNTTFPNWMEVLDVIRLVGYRKTMPSELNLSGAKDWREQPTAAHAVRERAGQAPSPGAQTGEQTLFVAAIEGFKRANGKTFPTWTEVLEVIRLLGYRKTVASGFTLLNAEDWREQPDAASGVRDRENDRRAEKAA